MYNIRLLSQMDKDDVKHIQSLLHLDHDDYASRLSDRQSNNVSSILSGQVVLTVTNINTTVTIITLLLYRRELNYMLHANFECGAMVVLEAAFRALSKSLYKHGAQTTAGPRENTGSHTCCWEASMCPWLAADHFILQSVVGLLPLSVVLVLVN